MARRCTSVLSAVCIEWLSISKGFDRNRGIEICPAYLFLEFESNPTRELKILGAEQLRLIQLRSVVGANREVSRTEQRNLREGVRSQAVVPGFLNRFEIVEPHACSDLAP